MSENKQNFLVFLLDYLGDFIVTLKTLDLLNKDFNANYYLLTWLKYKPIVEKYILEQNRNLKCIYIDSEKNIDDELQFCLSNIRFHKVIGLSDLNKWKVFSNLNKKSKKYVILKSRPKWYQYFYKLWKNVRININFTNIHCSQRIFVETSKIFNINTKVFSSNFKIGEKIRKNYVIILGSNVKEKNMSPDIYGGLANRLFKDYGLKPIIIGTQNELYLLEQFKLSYKHEFIDLVGKTKVIDVFDKIEHCNFILTNDTGPYHIANFLGINTFLFINKNYEKTNIIKKIWYPYKESEFFLRLDRNFFNDNSPVRNIQLIDKIYNQLCDEFVEANNGVVKFRGKRE